MTISNLPYCWQKKNWEKLIQTYKQQTLHHGLPLYGIKGLGKLDFARHFSQFLLCESPIKAEQPCYQCKSCSLFQAESHPDFHVIMPEKIGKSIKVDSIRELLPHATESSLRAGVKVVLIEPAEAMNLNAANALLKILEEPFQESYFFLLVSHEPERLPPTIRSRLVKISFSIQNREEIFSFLSSQSLAAKKEISFALEIMGYAPFEALRWIKDNVFEKFHLVVDLLFSPQEHFLDKALKLSKLTDFDWLTSLFYILHTILLFKNNVSLENSNLANLLMPKRQYLLESLTTKKIFYLLDQLAEWKRQLQNGVMLNKQMMAETIFYYVNAR